MTTKIHLVRHGQTNWNKEGRYQGQTDIPLNETGIEQAKKAAQLLSGNGNYSAIYASDLSRACQTAEEIAKVVNLPIQTDARLREIHQGEWEGKYVEEIMLKNPGQFTSYRNNPLNSHPPGGENIGQVGERMYASLDEIAAKHPNQEIIIVSHGMAIATVLCKAENVGLDKAGKMIPKNSEIKTVTW